MAEVLTYIGLSFVVVLVLVFLRRRKKSESPIPKDTVVLHQVGRGPWAPSLSPFPMKLETYLRMTKIPYVSDHKNGMSSKGKTPWISYNGEDVADSQFCIEYLNKKLDIDLSSHLTTEQRAVAGSFQRLADEHLYWAIARWRWIDNPDRSFIMDAFQAALRSRLLSRLFIMYVQRVLRKQLHGQGFGRHTCAETLQIAEEDLRFLSDFLGKKKFLMGDEPCEQDCSVFSMLAQIVWHSNNSPHEKLLKEKFPNLQDYCFRVREKFWPDWDECITHGHTKEATK